MLHPAVVLVVALTVLLLPGRAVAQGNDNDNEPSQTAIPAPAFTLEAPDGTPHSLAEFRGQVVLMMFWVSWADTCRHMGDAHLLRIFRSLDGAGKPFRVVLVGGGHNDNAMRQQSAATQHDWPFQLLSDPDHVVTRLYGAENWGWLALVDEAGNLVATGNHDALGHMEAWLSDHFDVEIATAAHNNTSDNDASVVILTIVGVLALLLMVPIRKRKPLPAA